MCLDTIRSEPTDEVLSWWPSIKRSYIRWSDSSYLLVNLKATHRYESRVLGFLSVAEMPLTCQLSLPLFVALFADLV